MRSSPGNSWSLRLGVQVLRQPTMTPAARRVAAIFGLPPQRRIGIVHGGQLRIAVGEIVAVIGPSGAGKSLLLQAATRRLRGAICLTPIGPRAEKRPAVEALRGGTLKRKLAILSRCGLAEATALVAPAGRLSDGQRFRLALARALHRALRSNRPRLIVADEFCSTLDAATAAVLCRQIARLVRSAPCALLLATPRTELLPALKPARILVQPLGGAWRVRRYRPPRRDALPDPRRWRITRGTLREYAALAPFHYLAGPPAAHKRVYVVRTPRPQRRNGAPEIAAVLVVSPPVLSVRGRNVATFGRYAGPDRRAALARLNAEVECISRVIVHPTYRGAGLAKRLVRHALADAETPVVEALAAMGKICPFFAAAGMTPVGLFRGRNQYYHYYISQPPEWFRQRQGL